MPFKKGQSGNPAGGKKGPRKPRTFEAGLLQAVESLGESDYKRIVRLALMAMENEIFVESQDGQYTVKKVIYNFDPLKAILPYVARRAESVKPAGQPETPVLDTIRKELESYNQPSDTATA